MNPFSSLGLKVHENFCMAKVILVEAGEKPSHSIKMLGSVSDLALTWYLIACNIWTQDSGCNGYY